MMRGSRAVVMMLSMGTAGCLEPNPDWRRPTDLTQCQPRLDGGGGGHDRPMVRMGGLGRVGGDKIFMIADFELDVFEVTVAAYRECVNGVEIERRCTLPGTTSPNCNWTPTPAGRENHPINCINWQQANAFCKWADRRLPTEAEWTFAAGGAINASSKYPWGDDEPIKTGDKAQLCWNQSGSTCSVGQFMPTLPGGRACGGIADLAGNVWEWTKTHYEETYQHPGTECNPKTSAECSLRGGDWYITDLTKQFQAATRSKFSPIWEGDNVGVRCARTP